MDVRSPRSRRRARATRTPRGACATLRSLDGVSLPHFGAVSGRSALGHVLLEGLRVLEEHPVGVDAEKPVAGSPGRGRIGGRGIARGQLQRRCTRSPAGRRAWPRSETGSRISRRSRPQVRSGLRNAAPVAGTGCPSAASDGRVFLLPQVSANSTARPRWSASTPAPTIRSPAPACSGSARTRSPA